jgi:Sulfotransferase family
LHGSIESDENSSLSLFNPFKQPNKLDHQASILVVKMLISTKMLTRKMKNKSCSLLLLSVALMFGLISYQTSNYMTKNFVYDHPSRRIHLEDTLNLPQHRPSSSSSSFSTARLGKNSQASIKQQAKAQPISSLDPVAISTPELVLLPYQVDKLLIQQGDSIYLRQGWDTSPVVLEEYKLLFFTTAKVGCTVWKQLFRRMMGYEDWKAENTNGKLPWNPEANGLKYLHHYSRQAASEMMTSPKWTRAIFVRDPKERFLSAYLDKVVQNPFFTRHVCCPYKMNCVSNQTSLQGFLELVQTCENNQYVYSSTIFPLFHILRFSTSSFALFCSFFVCTCTVGPRNRVVWSQSFGPTSTLSDTWTLSLPMPNDCYDELEAMTVGRSLVPWDGARQRTRNKRKLPFLHPRRQELAHATPRQPRID